MAWCRGLIFASLIFQCLAAAAGSVPGKTGPVAIRAGHLFDGTDDRLRSNVVILVEDGRIKALGEGVAIPAGTPVINLSGATVLPGLIDVHAHILFEAHVEGDAAPIPLAGQLFLTRTSARKALDGLRNARVLLESGFTTLRDPGDMDVNRAHLDVRDAINQGHFPGPRIFAAVHGITRTGGHLDFAWLATDQPQLGYAHLVDSPDAMRHAVRKEVKDGADWIKLAATGGLTTRTNPSESVFTDAELGVAVEEAHRLGKKIAAHAHGLSGIKGATRAGVDSIEHATYADDDALRAIAKAKIYIVPTYGGRLAKNPDRSDWLELLRRQPDYKGWPLIASALKLDVKIAFGTDTGTFAHGLGARQLAMLIEGGMKPAAAIRTATSAAADLLDLQGKVGRVVVGMEADLIAVPGNPLTNVQLLEHVGFVMVRGQVVKNEISANP